MDGDLDALVRLGLLGQCPGAADPGDDPVELLVEIEAVQDLSMMPA